MKNNLNILGLILLSFCFNARSQEFSTAGFYQTNQDVRKASNFNVEGNGIKKLSLSKKRLRYVAFVSHSRQYDILEIATH